MAKRGEQLLYGPLLVYLFTTQPNWLHFRFLFTDRLLHWQDGWLHCFSPAKTALKIPIPPLCFLLQ